MSLKVKLISCISAFILVLSMLFVGVFAAQNVQLNVGGSVSFTATSVYAQITGSYVGTAEHPSQAQSLTPIDIDAETTDGAVDMPDDWTNMPLNFDASGSEITVTISIKNLATDREIAVSLRDNTSITGVNVERKYNSSSFTDNTSIQTIEGGDTGTFTFTLSLTNKNNDISGDFSLNIDLARLQTYKATITNSSDYTLYAMGDDGQVHTIDIAGSLELQTSKVSFAFESIAFDIVNSNGNNELEIYAVFPGEVTQKPEPGTPILRVNGEDIAVLPNMYVCSGSSNKWYTDGSPSYASQVEISEDGYILTFTMAADTVFTL